MDFSYLPDNVFVKILEYLPLEYCVRVGRVDKKFRRIAQLATSHTKTLDLTEDRFQNLTDYQLAVILDLCSPNLQRIKFPSRDSMKAGSDWRQQIPILDNRGRELATTFAFYHCNRLIDIDLGRAPIDYAVFNRLIRNDRRLESLVFREEFIGFPDVVNNNLKKLHVGPVNDVVLQSLIGRCPNLKDFRMETEGITNDIFDLFFESVPRVQKLNLLLDYEDDVSVDAERLSLRNIWNLPLISLSLDFSIRYRPIDGILQNVATSFPHLKKFHLSAYEPEANINHGISALATLQDMEILEFNMHDGVQDFDQGIRQLVACKKLRSLVVYQLEITCGTLIALLRGCPFLEHIKICGIFDVDTPEEAVVVLESLSGIGKREITISKIMIERWPPDNDDRPTRIWKSTAVNEAISKLEETDGLKITFGSVEGFCIFSAE